MIKSQDVVVLVELLGDVQARTLRSIAASLALDVASVHRSIARLEAAGLWNAPFQQVPRPAAVEFLTVALKYLFPARLGPLTRGTPAAWAASPIAERLAPATEVPVWPDAAGTVRGPELTPLHPSLSSSIVGRPAFAEVIVLLDCIRAGDARVRAIAVEELTRRILHAEAAA